MGFPLTIDAESVTFDTLESGEWEIRIERPDSDDLYHYEDMPDMIYDQLVESGDINPETFFD